MFLEAVLKILDLLHKSFLPRHSVRPEPVEGRMNPSCAPFDRLRANGMDFYKRNGLLQEVYYKKCALLSFRLTRTGRKFMILSREFCAIENRQTIHSRYAADVIR